MLMRRLIKSYVRKDGTFVRGHYRSVPVKSEKFHDGTYIYDFSKKAGVASFGVCGFIPEDRPYKEVERTEVAEYRADAHRETLMPGDFGPQRFCNVCGCKLEDVYESKDSNAFFRHPENDCELSGIFLDEDQMNSGIANHDNLTMDDLRRTYRGLKDKDAQWLKKNKDVLKKIYEEHSDDKDAAQEKAFLPLLYNDDGELVTDVSNEDMQGRLDSPIRKDGASELSNKELWLIGRLAGSKGGSWKEIRYTCDGIVEKIHGRSFLLYSAKKSIDLVVDNKDARASIKEYLAFIALYWNLEGISPQKDRYLSRYPRNWKELEYSIAQEERELEYFAMVQERAEVAVCGY